MLLSGQTPPVRVGGWGTISSLHCFSPLPFVLWRCTPTPGLTILSSSDEGLALRTPSIPSPDPASVLSAYAAQVITSTAPPPEVGSGHPLLPTVAWCQSVDLTIFCHLSPPSLSLLK